MNIYQSEENFICYLADIKNEELIDLLFELGQESQQTKSKAEFFNLYRKTHLIRKEILSRIKK